MKKTFKLPQYDASIFVKDPTLDSKMCHVAVEKAIKVKHDFLDAAMEQAKIGSNKL